MVPEVGQDIRRATWPQSISAQVIFVGATGFVLSRSNQGQPQERFYEFDEFEDWELAREVLSIPTIWAYVADVPDRRVEGPFLTWNAAQADAGAEGQPPLVFIPLRPDWDNAVWKE